MPDLGSSGLKPNVVGWYCLVRNSSFGVTGWSLYLRFQGDQLYDIHRIGTCVNVGNPTLGCQICYYCSVLLMNYIQYSLPYIVCFVCICDSNNQTKALLESNYVASNHHFWLHFVICNQTKYKLYLVLDFINGGHLLFQLRRQRLFRYLQIFQPSFVLVCRPRCLFL